MNFGRLGSFIIKNRSLLVLNAALIVFGAVMLWIKPVDGLRKYSIYDHPNEDEGSLMPVYGSISLSQSFRCSENSDSFEVQVSSLNDEYHGNFSVKLLDDEDNEIDEWCTDKLDTVSGWVQYTLKKGTIEAGKEYKIYICAPQLNEFSAIGITVFPEHNSMETGKLLYGDSGADLNFDGKVIGFGVYRRQINVFAIAAFICLFAGVNICFVIRHMETDKFAVPVLITSGLIMLFILAPGCGPDDAYHYYSSVILSNRMLMHDNIDEIENKYKSDLPIHHNTNIALIETYEGLRYRISGEEGTYVFSGKRDNLKWPVSHLSQAIGISIGRLFKFGFIRVYTLGRLFNMAAYIALAILAIRLVPINKELMLMMAIMPMSMQQATQLSYDAPLNGLALVFTGYVFRILFEKKLFGWKETIFCALMIIAISPLKVIYILLGILLLLIPGCQFKSLSDRLFKIGVQVVCGVTALLVTRSGDVSANVLRNSAEATARKGISGVENYSIWFAIKEPVRFIRLLFSNGENHMSNMIKGMIGESIAGFSLGIPEQLVLLFALCLFLCAIAEKGSLFDKGWQIAVILGIALLGYFAVLTVFAFAETVYGLPDIGGIQGRYLIPFLFPLMYCLCGRKINISISRLSIFIPIAFIELEYIVEVMSRVDF